MSAVEHMDQRLVFEMKGNHEIYSMALHSTGLSAARMMSYYPTSAAQFLDMLVADLATLQFHLPGSCLNRQSVSWHRQNL